MNHPQRPSANIDNEWAQQRREVGEPDPLADEPDEPSELEAHDAALVHDVHWEAFIPDDDERDPLPEPGDFWIERAGD